MRNKAATQGGLIAEVVMPSKKRRSGPAGCGRSDDPYFTSARKPVAMPVRISEGHLKTIALVAAGFGGTKSGAIGIILDAIGGKRTTILQHPDPAAFEKLLGALDKEFELLWEELDRLTPGLGACLPVSKDPLLAEAVKKERISADDALRQLRELSERLSGCARSLLGKADCETGTWGDLRTECRTLCSWLKDRLLGSKSVDAGLQSLLAVADLLYYARWSDICAREALGPGSFPVPCPPDLVSLLKEGVKAHGPLIKAVSIRISHEHHQLLGNIRRQMKCSDNSSAFRLAIEAFARLPALPTLMILVAPSNYFSRVERLGDHTLSRVDNIVSRLNARIALAPDDDVIAFCQKWKDEVVTQSRDDLLKAVRMSRDMMRLLKYLRYMNGDVLQESARAWDQAIGSKTCPEGSAASFNLQAFFRNIGLAAEKMPRSEHDDHQRN